MKEKNNKIGRNQPCHCGSGRKYKKCCLNKDQNERRNQMSNKQEIPKPNITEKICEPSVYARGRTNFKENGKDKYVSFACLGDYLTKETPNSSS